MDLDDKIAEWKKQIDQAQEYGLLFDWQTVNEIVVELMQLKSDYEELANVTME